MRLSCHKLVASGITHTTKAGVSTRPSPYRTSVGKSLSKGQYMLGSPLELLSCHVKAVKPITLTLPSGKPKQVYRGLVKGVEVERVRFLQGMGRGLPGLWSRKLTVGILDEE